MNDSTEAKNTRQQIWEWPRLLILDLLSVCFLLLFNPINAQEVESINYTTEHGLPSNEVYDLFEDKDGFVWAGTNKGAARLNSDIIQPLTIGQGLADRDILTIDQDSKGNVWFLSYNGKLSYWNDGKIYNENDDDRLKTLKSKGRFTSFLEDKSGNLWFSTYTDGVYFIDTLQKVHHIVDISPSRRFHASPFFGVFSATYLFEVKSGEIHFANPFSCYVYKDSVFHQLSPYPRRQRRGWFAYRGNGIFASTANQISHFSISKGKTLWEKSLPQVKIINGVEFLRDSLLYLATDNGVYVIDQNGTIVHQFLAGHNTSDMLIDWEGNLWVSTLSEGIFIIKNRGVLNYSAQAKHAILNRGTSLLIGGLGTKFHAYDGKTFFLLPVNNEAGRYNPKINPFAANQDKVLTIVEDDHHRIWFGTYNGLYQLVDYKAKHYFSKGVKKLLYLNASLFAILPSNELIQMDIQSMELIHQQFTKNNENDKGIQRDFIIDTSQFYSIARTKSNQLIGGTDRGVVILKDSIFHLLKELPKWEIIDIKEESTGNLWLLEKNKGLYYYRIANDQLDTLNLFPDNKHVLYTSMVVEQDGCCWIGTDNGLVNVKFDQHGFLMHHFNGKSGLMSEDINAISILNDTIWLATSEGVSILPKQSLKDTIAPLLHLDSLLINGSVFKDSNLLNITIEQNSLFIHFTGISYKDDGELTYKYTLEGEYTEKGVIKERFLDLYELPPSKYTLSIIAVDAATNESKLKELIFTVRQLWWKSWKNWLLIVFGVVLCLGLALRIIWRKSFTKMYGAISKQLALKEKEKFIVVKSVMTGADCKILLKDLFYIKVSGDYTEFFKQNEVILVRSSMKRIEEMLVDEDAFLRVHKSYLVNLKKVKASKSDHLEVLEQHIPVSRRKREEVKNRLAYLFQ